MLSISATTRPMRPGEKDGVDYHFVDHATFDRMVAEGAFLEHAKVFDHQYGTPRVAVEHSLAAGRDVLFDIDWQGTQQLAQSARADLVSVFILPPTIAALEQRLKTRAQDSADVVARRMAKAADEMSHWAEYDYIIVNDDLEVSIQRVRADPAGRTPEAPPPGRTGGVRKGAARGGIGTVTSAASPAPAPTRQTAPRSVPPRAPSG